MNQLVPTTPAQTTQIEAFVAEHGAGLDQLLRDILNGPGAAITGTLIRLARAGAPAAAKLDQLLDGATQTLLDHVGQTPARMATAAARPDLDAALRWYAARLTDLRV